MTTETSKLIDPVSLTLLSDEGREYTITQCVSTTIQNLKQMAVAHFYSPQEVENIGGPNRQDYCFILLREYRRIDNESLIHRENLQDGDTLLLVPSRNAKKDGDVDSEAPRMTDIATATHSLPACNQERGPLPINMKRDFKVDFNEICYALIETSACIIVATLDDYDGLFDQIFIKLESKHKQPINKALLKSLTDMGFPINRARSALLLKRNLDDAVEHLVSTGGLTEEEEQDVTPQNPSGSTSELDPVQNLLLRVKKFKIKYNNMNPNKVVTIRDDHILSAMLDCPIIQVHLAKPKILHALIHLYENSTSVNVWLSDPDTKSFITQLLRIYHFEKHNDPKARHTPEPANNDQINDTDMNSVLETSDVICSHIWTVDDDESEMLRVTTAQNPGNRLGIGRNAGAVGGMSNRIGGNSEGNGVGFRFASPHLHMRMEELLPNLSKSTHTNTHGSTTLGSDSMFGPIPDYIHSKINVDSLEDNLMEIS